MEKIVFLDRATLAPQITLKPPSFAHHFTAYDKTSPAQAAERLAGATVAITNKVPLSADTLAQVPTLRLIAVAATGTDCVDKAYCQQHGITVCNIQGYAVHTVPEHTFALLLALRRSLMAYRADVQAGAWQKAQKFCFFDHPIRDLYGARLGIIGGGSLGQAVAALGRAFGMEPVFASRKGDDGDAMKPGYLPWDEVLATSDVLTLHCPLTPQTRGLIGWPEFQAMAQRPLLLNTARGGLVVEADLVRALDAGLISGAGFDVTDGEPPALDSPMMALAHRPNVIVTPHVAWASDQAMQSLADQLIGNIEAFMAGAARNVVRA